MSNGKVDVSAMHADTADKVYVAPKLSPDLSGPPICLLIRAELFCCGAVLLKVMSPLARRVAWPGAAAAAAAQR